LALITFEFIVPFFLAIFPLTVSPGPANLLLASSGTTFGFRKTVPFILGIFTIFALQCLVVGIGLAELVFRYPAILRLFQYAGAAYLIYLAYHFFRASAIEDQEKQTGQGLGFKEGAVLELLNFKALAVQATMFSLFLDPAGPQWVQVLLLTALLVTIGAASGLIWVLAGDLLGRFLKREKVAVWQGRVFGSILLLVALWMILRA
jgi:homoserine/homoserine lactone efflux protein